jgi:hypothetical protein
MLIFPRRAQTVKGVSNVLLLGQPEHSIAAEVLGDLPLCAETLAAMTPAAARDRAGNGHATGVVTRTGSRRN